MCQQSVGLLQRGVDEAGIATVSITQVPDITELAKPSLSCFVAHPFGLTLGAPHDATTHHSVLRAVFEVVDEDHAPGTIVPLTQFRWPDDLRRRQLRKQAH